VADQAGQPSQRTLGGAPSIIYAGRVRIINFKTRLFAACAVAVTAWVVMTAVPFSYAQTPLSPELQEIVKFTQAHMTDDVIVAYIKNSGKAYSVNADALLTLNSMGVSQPVLSALLAAAPSPASAPAPAPAAPQQVPPPGAPMTAPPETPNIDYFQAHLTPYGQWIDVPGVGAAWVPAEANIPGWRPYMDAGHWQFTDAGWFWQSDYPWGDMAFHYGRWINNEFTGGRWAWVPGYNWAPSWVSWREGAGGLGWAPLPWDVEFRVGLGLYWHGGLVVEGVDFGLGFGAFVFVGGDHFWGGNYRAYAFDNIRAREFFAHSQFHAGYRMEGGHLMAEGLGREHMKEITHHEVAVQRASELRHAEEHQNFAKRTEAHHELTRAPERGREPARTEASRAPAAGERATGKTPERTPATSAHPGSPTGATTGTPGHPGAPGSAAAGAKAPPSHAQTQPSSSKPSAPAPEKKP
jgi:hypothetical protein